eukprot:CAMPEP_0173378564 /NCGR_PEP_ID=MMETSP1356-20130122/1706_1 /TAXON_ID=77927 ORGANISM="Hemiselmis virescens, Strain PCC157" /NCGR_SAMPLE_ID=MMETSP1356 /ASSEMBLY_ACC=CAM_ASM_000847 /LENGTH=36 /DNA_ID= /DNA_START= /DNA_END= /DNA_ORIENTATION=
MGKVGDNTLDFSTVDGLVGNKQEDADSASAKGSFLS